MNTATPPLDADTIRTPLHVAVRDLEPHLGAWVVLPTREAGFLVDIYVIPAQRTTITLTPDLNEVLERSYPHHVPPPVSDPTDPWAEPPNPLDSDATVYPYRCTVCTWPITWGHTGTIMGITYPLRQTSGWVHIAGETDPKDHHQACPTPQERRLRA